MAASNMDGLRGWKFTANGVTVSLAKTDFWVSPEGEEGSTQNLIPRVILNDIWEHADSSADAGLERRKYIEDRIAEIRDMLFQQGTLIIDEGETEEETFTNITLVSMSVKQDTNDLLEYTLEFGFPQVSTGAGGGGVMLASKIEFGDEGDEDRVFIDSKNMVLELTNDNDKTVFKEIFRAAPIRVQGSVPLKFINVLGIIDKNVPSFWSMTADTNDGADYRANKLLDLNGTKFWRSTDTALPHWIRGYRGDFSLFKVYRYGIKPATLSKAPTDWTLEGSILGTSTWVTLDTQVGVSGWAAGVEKTFDLLSTVGNYKYLRLNISGVSVGIQVEIKEFNLYPFSAAKADSYHSAQHGQRFRVGDRVRMLRWLQLGRSRKLKINEDSLLGTADVVAHLQDVQIDDIEGLEMPAYKLTFAYGFGE